VSRVHGTAFSIGGDLFLTAAHVATAAAEAGDPWLGYLVGGKLRAARVSQHSLLDGVDLAILKCRVPDTKALRWTRRELPMLEDVQAAGYPFALDPEAGTVVFRAFKGYVVSTVRGRRFKDAPWCYELSFACPEGLSGAPLWHVGEDPVVVGVVLGTSSTVLEVLSSRERLVDGREQLLEQHRVLGLGFAVQSQAALAIEAPLLGGSLEQHLSRVGLVSK
jgi:hypothetical protein